MSNGKKSSKTTAIIIVSEFVVIICLLLVLVIGGSKKKIEPDRHDSVSTEAAVGTDAPIQDAHDEIENSAVGQKEAESVTGQEFELLPVQEDAESDEKSDADAVVRAREEEQELIQAAEESRTQYKISTIGAGISQRKAALQFARSFDKMDDETALRVLELLSSKEDGD